MSRNKAKERVKSAREANRRFVRIPKKAANRRFVRIL